MAFAKQMTDEVSMSKEYNKRLVKYSQELRKNMTKEEQRLWYNYLRFLPVGINRQKVIGNYIVDFYCASAKIVIEIDGSQHYEETGIAKDIARDEYLGKKGIKVLRYSNRDINTKFNVVCQDIYNHIMTPHSSPQSGNRYEVTPSPQGEGKKQGENMQ